MLSTVVFLFAICWLPYHIVLMYTEWSYSKLSQALTSVILLAQWLVFANSTFNPFVYAVLNENYRCKFKILLHLRRRNRRRNNVIIRVQTIRNENLRWRLILPVVRRPIFETVAFLTNKPNWPHLFILIPKDYRTRKKSVTNKSYVNFFKNNNLWKKAPINLK